MVSFFDSVGTLISLTASSHDLLEKDWAHSKRFQKALVAENITSILAGLLGTSTASIYLENATGIKVGGRTGLTALIVALLFLLVLFFSPLVKMVPAVATAPALLYIAILMFKNLARIDFNDITAYIPALLAVVFIPLTFSITNGIGIAFITYLVLKTLCGKYRMLHGLEVALGILFILYFIYLAYQ